MCDSLSAKYCICHGLCCFPLSTWFCPTSRCCYWARSSRARARRNCVGSTTPNKVIVRRVNSAGHYLEQSSSNGHDTQSQNNGDCGITNLTFQPDDGEISFTITEVDNDDLPKEQVQQEPGQLLAVTPKSIANRAKGPRSSINTSYLKYLSSLFLKTAPGKCIHVVHIRTKTKTAVSTSSSLNNSSNKLSVPSAGIDCSNYSSSSSCSSSGDDEDEDEYWFSKWSKRPKLKNTFKLNGCTTSATTGSDEQSARRESKIVVKYGRFSVSKCDNNTCTNSHHQNAIKMSTKDTVVDPIEVISPDEIHLDLDLAEQHLPCNSNTNDNSNNNRNLSYNDSSGGFTNLAYQSSESTEQQPSSPVPDLVESTQLNSDKTEESSKHYPSNSNNCDLKESTLSPVGGGGESTSTKSPCISTPNPNRNSILSSSSPASTNNTTKSGPPILFFIHGISSSSDIWTNQLEYFHTLGYEIVLIDLLGHGLSSTPSKAKLYTFESLLQDIVYVYDYFIPLDAPSQRSTVLIGHGYGSCFATVLARIRPTNVASLISFSGGGPTPLANGCIRPPSLIPFQLSNLFAKKREVGRFDPSELKHVLPPHIRQAMIDGQIWLECDAAFHHRIKIPTLLIYGLRDNVVTLVEECEMEKAIPKAFLELLPFAGHFSMCDEPKKCNRMMHKFIQGWVQST